MIGLVPGSVFGLFHPHGEVMREFLDVDQWRRAAAWASLEG
jgi:hypothetical protein